MAKSPRRPRPAPAAAAQQAADDDSEPFDFQEVFQDLSEQISTKTMELAAAKSVIRRLRREKEELKQQLVEKSKNAPVQE